MADPPSVEPGYWWIKVEPDPPSVEPGYWWIK